MVPIIYINGYFMTSEHKSGVQRFAWQTLWALDLQITKDKKVYKNLLVVIVIPNYVKDVIELNMFQNIGYIHYGNLVNQYLWEQINLAWYTRGQFLINLCNFAPIFKRKQLCVIHDTLVYKYPKSYTKKFVFLTKLLQRLIIKNSAVIASVSQFSKNEILDNIGIPKNPILVLENSAENFNSYVADIQVLARHDIKPGTYVLAVFSQSNSLYKNVAIFLAAISRIKQSVICVGNLGNEYFKNNKQIKNIGYISDNELKALYQNALVFVFPSLYEGFGVPPLEAMICSCPVIASDILVLHEVCKDAAIYFDPQNPQDLIDKIDLVANNSVLRTELIENGYKRSANYSWRNNALQLLDIVNQERS